ncbi:uncharacterized protein DUF4350 [Streptomyces sp. Ag109_G2-6]|uniref:DUF4350 domain-containing protein n=1 Tax=Streptomyces sp. Ag109_G2-6 TaxID=2485154 RepID=UPI000FA5BB47|nr:DUF4350 domain-containing protein [Streptomyces sp. Ag109_G2-6]RPF40904.1 uncharacterized protein DUF4350 [Streptomyces sp. Ag109_G2-6]
MTGHPTQPPHPDATPGNTPEPATPGQGTPTPTPGQGPATPPEATAPPAPDNRPTPGGALQPAATTPPAGTGTPAQQPAPGRPHTTGATPGPAAGTPAPGTATPPPPAAAGPGTPTPTPGQGKGKAATSTALGPAQLWARARGLLLALAVLLVAAVALAGLQAGDHHGRLDPRSADRDGSRALARLLEERGVTTRVVTNAEEAAAAAGPRTTLLVTDPDLLGAPQRSAIRSAIDLSGGRTLLVAPTATALAELAPAVHTKGFARRRDLDPACPLPTATTAGRAGTGDGLRYATDLPGATGCYPSDGHPTLLVLPGTTRGGDTVLLGSDQPLLNRHLAEEGNASLALQLLGSRPELVWYLPTLADMPADGPAQDKSLLELVPSGWYWALLQLFAAAALAALWRARRLGPLVTEDLPVAIRASETTEGRARLYRKAAARDRAADVLRAAARERLAALAGVPPAQAHDPAVLTAAVSARLPEPPDAATGRDVTTLLFGPTPADDAALVALADHLDALEREVRTS